MGFLWGHHRDGGLVGVLWGVRLTMPAGLARGPGHARPWDGSASPAWNCPTVSSRAEVSPVMKPRTEDGRAAATPRGIPPLPEATQAALARLCANRTLT